MYMNNAIVPEAQMGWPVISGVISSLEYSTEIEKMSHIEKEAVAIAISVAVWTKLTSLLYSIWPRVLYKAHSISKDVDMAVFWDMKGLISMSSQEIVKLY